MAIPLVVLESDVAADYTALAAAGAANASFGIADLVKGSYNAGTKTFLLKGIVLKVDPDTPAGTFDQGMTLYFFSDSDYNAGTFAACSLAGIVSVPAGAGNWSVDQSRYFWADHDVNLTLFDNAGSDSDGQIHLCIAAVTGGGLLAADSLVVELHLLAQ